MNVSEKTTDSAYEAFMAEVEFIINLHVNSCDEDLIKLARVNMYDRLDRYILMYTNLVINDLKEEGVIVSN